MVKPLPFKVPPKTPLAPPVLVLLDAVGDDDSDEQTTEHTPDPSLLHRAAPPQRMSEAPAAEPPAPKAPVALVRTECLTRLLERYVDCVGPAARPLLLREIGRLGATPQQFPVSLRGQLALALAQRLDEPGARNAFYQDALFILGGTAG